MVNFFFRIFFSIVLMTVFCVNFPLVSYADTQTGKSISLQKDLEKLEVSSGDRLGVYALNTANNEYIQYRADERFPFCSTFKIIVVGAILQRSMTNHDLLQQKIKLHKEDMDVVWAPVTAKHIGDDMTISELSAASIEYSDEAATNLLIKKLGGLEAVNTFAHSIGNNAFNLNRWESGSNTAIPEDMRDTSTPRAMAASLQRLVLGNALGPVQRKQLETWLKDVHSSLRIRAGVPKGWVVANKTGTGLNYGVINDIAIIWPPTSSQCAPIVIAMYLQNHEYEAPHRDDIIASATRLVLNEFAKTDQCLRKINITSDHH